MSTVKTQHGIATIPAGQTSVTLTAGVHYDAVVVGKGFLSIIANNNCGDSQGGYTDGIAYAWGYVSDQSAINTSVTLSRPGAGGADLLLPWQIDEYIGPAGGAHEWKVRGTEALAMTTTDTVNGATIAGVVSGSKVEVRRTGLGANGSVRDALGYASWDNTAHQAVWYRARTSNAAAYVSYAVIEYTGSAWNAVQRILHVYSAVGVAETHAITDVGSITRAMCHSQVLPTTGANSDCSQRVRLTASNAVTFEADSHANLSGIDSGSNPVACSAVAWVVSNSFAGTGAMVVARYTGSIAQPATSGDQAITAVDRTQSSIVEFSQTNGQTSASIARDQLAFQFTTDTNIALYSVGLADTSQYGFGVVAWPTVGGGGGGAMTTQRRTMGRGFGRGLNRGFRGVS